MDHSKELHLKYRPATGTLVADTDRNLHRWNAMEGVSYGESPLSFNYPIASYDGCADVLSARGFRG